MLIEANIDALVGPTHHYGGLGLGNLASIEHQGLSSSPRRAALEGLSKASMVSRLGVPQFVMPPPLRPRLDFLDHLGFGGTLAETLQAALESCPRALSAAYSSAFMWAANSACVSPAVDAIDGRLHITLANMLSNWHRAFEAAERTPDFESLLGSLQVAIHPALPGVLPLRDEGAANHMRLCDPSGRVGFHLFVYGADDASLSGSSVFLPRQTREACEAIARLHRLRPDRTFFLQQHPSAISAGVFHNDVIATSHLGLLIHHELAFAGAHAELERLERAFRATTGEDLLRVQVPTADMSLSDAVKSYFFNSQMISTPHAQGAHSRLMICPADCQQFPAAQRLIQQLIDDPLVAMDQVHFVSLAQSMAGGGGPACLRLRLPIEADRIDSLNAAFRLTPRFEERLAACIERYYPEWLAFADLANSDFVAEARRATQEVAACFSADKAAGGPSRW